MLNEKNGGPAFPGEYQFTIHHDNGGIETRTANGEGMSLRDYFAGQALAGIVPEGPKWTGNREVAALCYVYADAMLAARDEPE